MLSVLLYIFDDFCQVLPYIPHGRREEETEVYKARAFPKLIA